MPRKTDGEKLDELEKSVAAQSVRVENVLDGLVKIERDQKAAMQQIAELRREHEKALGELRREHEKELSLLKREVEELKKWKDESKKQAEEWSRRFWSFGPNLAAAVVNVLLAAGVAYLVSR
jgi:seryl-tRNA synthetase